MQSIVEMAAGHAVDCGEKTCIVDAAGRLTYREFFSMILGKAQMLEQKGIKKGDRVLVEMFPEASSLAAVLAVHLLGGSSVPVEKDCPEERMRQLILDSGAKAYFSGHSVEGAAIWLGADKAPAPTKEKWEGKFPSGKDIGDILFTTGTTGKSKGVMHSHRSIVAKAENVCYQIKLIENDVSLIPTPLNHGWGLSRCYAALMQGGTIVLMGGVANLKRFFTCLEKERITHLVLSPAMITMLFQITGDKIGEYGHTLRCLETGSAPIGEWEREKLLEYLPDTMLVITYGSTESGCTSAYDMNEEGNIPFYVGRPSPNARFEFVDEQGQSVSATREKPGRIVTAGDMNMSGYYGEPELTAGVLIDGKVYSSDWGWKDETERIFLLGRSGDVINMGGVKISAWEIEKEAMLWKEIKECACVPEPSDTFGEIPKLFVVLKEPGVFHRQEFMKFMKGRLEFSRLPKEVEVMDSLPKTFNGKIIKKGLIGK